MKTICKLQSDDEVMRMKIVNDYCILREYKREITETFGFENRNYWDGYTAEKIPCSYCKNRK